METTRSMATEHEDRVIRRFGIAVVATFAIFTAVPFAIAGSTGGHARPAADAGGQIAKSAQSATATPARGD